jgi:outer membrane protein W
MNGCWRSGLALLFIGMASAPAAAQARKGSWEAAAGVVWFSGAELGTSEATLETPGGGEFVLFRTATSLDAGVGAAAALTFFATERLAIEAGFSYARPGVSTRVTDDAEDGAAVTSSIGLQQYLIEGSARWYLARSFRTLRPFVRAGGGYLRQLDEQNAHVETGRAFHLGAGADRTFVERGQGRVRRMGMRLDARLVARSGGIGIDDGTRLGAAVNAFLFAGF